MERGFEKNITKAAPLDAPLPQKGQSVTVHCTGIVQATGKKFWSTKDAGQKPFTFTIGQGQVIKGWDEGVLTMQVTDKMAPSWGPFRYKLACWSA